MTIRTDRLFSEHQTTVKPHEKPSYLIVTGPFSLQPASDVTRYDNNTPWGRSLLRHSSCAFFIPLVFVVVMGVLFIPTEG